MTRPVLHAVPFATNLRRRPPQRRGSAIVVVIWVLALAAIVTSAVQLFGYRQASLGREAIARLQSRWAARAGVEQTIAVMAYHTEKPFENDARAMVNEMDSLATGDLPVGADLPYASYDIRHYLDRRPVYGPMDEHAKINLGLPSGVLRSLLVTLEDMDDEILDAIDDWTDKDDLVRERGAERDFYANMPFPYEPRNGPLRTVAELELIAGVWPKNVRGEDWNLNYRLDPSEDDGERTFPPDDPNGELEESFFSQLTTYTVANGATGSGEPRIRLGLAEVEELQERLGVDPKQAEMLIRFGRNTSNTMGLLLAYPLSRVQADGSVNIATQQGPATAQTGGAKDLSDEQLGRVFLETMLEGQYTKVPGKMNLNSVPPDLLRNLMRQLADDETLAEEIRYLRTSSPTGLVSVADLRKLPTLMREENRNLLQVMGDYFTTQSNVFAICSRGRSWSTGLESEMIVVVDRSTVPVKILEYREP
jgi:hypothetical protein